LGYVRSLFQRTPGSTSYFDGLRIRRSPSEKGFPIDCEYRFCTLEMYADMKGYSEVRYDEVKKRVVYEPLQLTQAYRYVQLSFSNDLG